MSGSSGSPRSDDRAMNRATRDEIVEPQADYGLLGPLVQRAANPGSRAKCGPLSSGPHGRVN